MCPMHLRHHVVPDGHTLLSPMISGSFAERDLQRHYVASDGHILPVAGVGMGWLRLVGSIKL